MCGCSKLVRISAIGQTFCQNSPNPFPPPPTALNRRKRTEAELQSYKKRGCRLLRSISSIFFWRKKKKKNPDTSAFHVSGPLFGAFFTIARLEKQADSQQKPVKLRSPRKKTAKLFWMLTNAPPMVSAIEQSTYKTSKLHKRLFQHWPYKALYVQPLLQREEAAAKVPSLLCCAILRPGQSRLNTHTQSIEAGRHDKGDKILSGSHPGSLIKSSSTLCHTEMWLI